MPRLQLIRFNQSRAECLSDGVFAIVMTLLVLEIPIPEISRMNDADQLKDELFYLLPKILSYLFSFATIYVYWVNHHLLFKLIKGANRNLLWLNGLFLLFLALIPFPTALIGEYYNNLSAVVLFGIIMFIVSVCFYMMVHYTSKANLLRSDMDHAKLKEGQKKAILGPILQAVGIALAFINTAVSLIFYAVILITFFFAVKVEYVEEHMADKEML